MKDRTTGWITSLKENEVFVYGDNTAHRHGAGAAKQALKFGAKHGVGPVAGQTYGIPTKDDKLKVLSIGQISKFVNVFITYAISHPEKIFLTSEIGCGLSKYTPKDIAPLFIDAVKVSNIYLPKKFWDVLS